MFLFGQRYNAPRLWSAARWDKELHPTMYYYARDDQDEYVSDNSEDGSSSDSENDNGRIHGWEGRSMAAKQWKWWSRNVPIALQGGRDTVLPLGTTCKTRSTLYHHLLHYKFRLLLKVRDKVNYTCTHKYIYIYIRTRICVTDSYCRLLNTYTHSYSFIHSFIHQFIHSIHYVISSTIVVAR